MKLRYQPQDFEEKWIKQWEKDQTYKTPDHTGTDENKKYVLVMFPYPSGAGLHTGHVRIYTGTDVLARYYRMQGKHVLHPMGWDAFGLPTENAAIKLKTNPKKLIPEYIQNFKRQMQSLGLSYDWNREMSTTDPEYYAITQWLFILFYKHGLLYKKLTPVYYCEHCKTGLALEEVMGDGTHERCGNTVVKKDLPQWIFRITSYAQSLLDSLEGLDWPQGILEMQKNWVGKKEGMEITYEVEGVEGTEGTKKTIACFTTRPDTNFGATFIVLSPEHEFVKGVNDQAVKDYVESALRKTERERQMEEKKKTGVFTGFFAINQLNGEKIPIWISDFVLPHVGTGAVVGVPGHDKRDFEFAQAFNIPIKRVVQGSDGDTSPIVNIEQVQEEEGAMMNSEFLDGMEIHEATEKMMDHLETKGWGKRVVSYHLRDWIFSRQRYWGEPIPMAYCKSCAEGKISYWNSKKIDKSELRLNKGPNSNSFGSLISEIEEDMFGWFPLPEQNLPLELPDIDSYEPTSTGESPLSKLQGWKEVECPNCGDKATRETDTMPNWAGSCWYFLQFTQDKIHQLDGTKAPWKTDVVDNWMPVDWYIGGAEHAVLHLLYTRFWMHVLNDLGVISFREPFRALRNVGMVLAQDNRKMSKSLGNVINPDEFVEEYGADALRVYEMFMAPFGQEVAWSSQTLQGSYRFIRRIWQIYNDPAKIAKDEALGDKELASELQRVITKITEDIPNVKFNTPIASMMEFLNMWEESGRTLGIGHAKDLLKLLAPFAPFVSEEIWREVFNEKESIHISSWPEADATVVLTKDIVIPVQVNGKVRGQVTVSPSMIDQDSIVAKALESDKIKGWIQDKKYRAVYVEGKILNLVTE
jgi:leucyl-tRNA synthetase